jgi:FKBP-type peptidyl-prolyl cis-trans isomerase SlyD
MGGSTHIGDGKVVTVHYKLSTPGGELLVDTSADEEPMSYLHGAENIVPGLERQLAGRQVGETLTAIVTPDEGYGERDDEAVQELPREAFPDDMQLEEGMQLTAEDDEGNLTPLYVREIFEDHVVVDMNHPLAGQTLHYEVTVVGIRDATEEERAHGHSHDEDGHGDHDCDHDHG